MPDDDLEALFEQASLNTNSSTSSSFDTASAAPQETTAQQSVASLSETPIEDAVSAVAAETEATLSATSVASSDGQLKDQGTLTVPDSCKHCGSSTKVVCPTCHGPYCIEHASILDPRYCRICLNEPMAELKIAPLKDENGVEHKGRELIPSGPVFGTTAKRIADMSDYELDAFVGHYKDLIHQAELALDFRRTMLGMGQLEIAQRKDAVRRKLRGVRVRIPGVANPSADKAVVGAAKPPKSSTKSAASPVFADMLKAIEALREMQKTKGYKMPEQVKPSSPAKPVAAPSVVSNAQPGRTIPRPFPRPEVKK